ncbi:MAG: biotin/lipoyl-binding protein [Flavobacteriales bacterium]|nr:biotin/lipoyl-binding protein [Flavobacteriales bacterium]
MSELKVEVENGNTYSIEDLKENEALLDGKQVTWDSYQVKDGKFHIIKGSQSYSVEVVNADAANKTFELKVNNSPYKTKVEDRFDLLLQQLGMDNLGSTAVSELKAPMPGMVLNIEVEAGQEVKEGDALVVLEAMKMENVLKSPADVVIKSIAVKKGIAVEKNELLIEFES